MKAEQVAKSKKVESEIDFIRAEEGVTDEELVSEIEQTKSEIDLNKALTRTFAKDSSESGEGEPARCEDKITESPAAQASAGYRYSHQGYSKRT